MSKIDGEQTPLPGSRPGSSRWDPETLDRSMIAVPLLRRIVADEAGRSATYDVIIDANLEFTGGREEARQCVRTLAAKIDGAQVNVTKTELSAQYVFGRFTGSAIQELVRQDRDLARTRSGTERTTQAVYRIWTDEPVRA